MEGSLIRGGPEDARRPVHRPTPSQVHPISDTEDALLSHCTTSPAVLVRRRSVTHGNSDPSRDQPGASRLSRAVVTSEEDRTTAINNSRAWNGTPRVAPAPSPWPESLTPHARALAQDLASNSRSQPAGPARAPPRSRRNSADSRDAPAANPPLVTARSRRTSLVDQGPRVVPRRASLSGLNLPSRDDAVATSPSRVASINAALRTALAHQARPALTDGGLATWSAHGGLLGPGASAAARAPSRTASRRMSGKMDAAVCSGRAFQDGLIATPGGTYELSTPVKDPPLNVASVLSHFLILGIRIVLGGLQKGFVLDTRPKFAWLVGCLLGLQVVYWVDVGQAIQFHYAKALTATLQAADLPSHYSAEQATDMRRYAAGQVWTTLVGMAVLATQLALVAWRRTGRWVMTWSPAFMIVLYGCHLAYQLLATLDPRCQAFPDSWVRVVSSAGFSSVVWALTLGASGSAIAKWPAIAGLAMGAAVAVGGQLWGEGRAGWDQASGGKAVMAGVLFAVLAVGFWVMFGALREEFISRMSRHVDSESSSEMRVAWGPWGSRKCKCRSCLQARMSGQGRPCLWQRAYDVMSDEVLMLRLLALLMWTIAPASLMFAIWRMVLPFRPLPDSGSGVSPGAREAIPVVDVVSCVLLVGNTFLCMAVGIRLSRVLSEQRDELLGDMVTKEVAQALVEDFSRQQIARGSRRSSAGRSVEKERPPGQPLSPHLGGGSPFSITETDHKAQGALRSSRLSLRVQTTAHTGALSGCLSSPTANATASGSRAVNGAGSQRSNESDSGGGGGREGGVGGVAREGGGQGTDREMETAPTTGLLKRLSMHMQRSIKKQKSAHALECTPDWPVTCDVPGSVPVDLTFYKEHPEVSMMFSDLVSWTTFSSQADPRTALLTLHTVFSILDKVTQYLNLHKYETVGDAYITAGNLISRDEHHREKALRMGVTLCNVVRRTRVKTGGGEVALEARVGLHCGPVAAGVLGLRRRLMCLVGDTVNVASRMETNSRPTHVNATAEFWEFLPANVQALFQPQTIPVKGKGEMTTYLLDVVRYDEELTDLGFNLVSNPDAWALVMAL